MLWENSADTQTDNISSYFLLENRFWNFMQTALRRQFAWNIKSYFLGKTKENISKCHLLKFYPACKVLTHFILETPKRVFGTQCRPRSDATECSIWSGSPLIANNFSVGISKGHRLIYLKLKFNSSNTL